MICPFAHGEKLVYVSSVSKSIVSLNWSKLLSLVVPLIPPYFPVIRVYKLVYYHTNVS